jgi:hypothetical protein
MPLIDVASILTHPKHPVFECPRCQFPEFGDRESSFLKSAKTKIVSALYQTDSSGTFEANETGSLPSPLASRWLEALLGRVVDVSV